MRWVRSPHFRSLLLLAVLTTLPYLPALLGPQRLAGHDLLNNFYPWKSFLVEEVSHGRLPLWNPYVFSGMPFAGNPQVGMFYPPDLPVFFMPLERFFPFFFALHAFLAAAAMYLWIFHHTGSCRAAVISGLAWAWCGYVSSNVFWGFTGLTAAAVYVPLGMLCLDRWFDRPNLRTFSFLAGVVALQVLAGHPQPVLYTGYLLVFYGLYLAIRRSGREGMTLAGGILRFLAVPVALAFAACLSAVVLLPAMEAGAASAVRGGGVSLEYAAHDSVPPLHLLTLIAPFLFGDPAGGGYWLSSTGYQEIGLYAGILVLAFAACAWQSRPVRLFLIAALVLSLLGALGSNTPFFKLLYLAATGFRWFRVPGRMLLIFSFCLVSLAGLGVADLINRPGRPLSLVAKALFGTIVFLEIVAIGWLWIGDRDMAGRLMEREIETVSAVVSSPDQIPAEVQAAMKKTVSDRIGTMRRSTLWAILWTVATGFLLMAIRRKAPPAPVAIGALVLLMLDLGRFHVHLIPAIGDKDYRESAFPESETVRFLKDREAPSRILMTDDVIGWQMRERHPELYPERPTIFGIETVRGYNPTIPADYAAYINRMQGWPEDRWVGGLLFLPNAGAMDREMLDRLSVDYLVSYQPAPATFETVLTDGNLNVYRNLQAFPRASIVRDGTPGVDRAEITKYTPNRVVVETDLETPGTLVLADTWFEGWKVKVDGESGELRKYDGAFRAVDLPAGNHEAIFVYAPASFYRGLALSGVGFVAFLALVAAPWRFKRKKKPPRPETIHVGGVAPQPVAEADQTPPEPPPAEEPAQRD